jgi:hypothetical protein
MLVSDIYLKTKEVLGRCPQDIVFQRLTEAIELLKNTGDWDPLLGYVDIQGATDLRTFTLPYDIDVPLAVNICGRPAYMRNKWAEFHLNGLGSNRETSWTWDDFGYFPIIQDVIKPSTLIAIADLRNDLQTQIQVFGYDVVGRRIRSQNPDGSWNDGAIYKPNLITDFPNGVITENTNQVFTRIFTAIPVTTLISAVPHGFQTGVQIILTLTSGSIPSPLSSGATYYLSVVDPYTIQLYNLLSDATAGTNLINMTGVSPLTMLDLKDQRQVQTQTKFTSASALNFIQASAVTFSGTTLPSPILADETFYLNLLDADDFTIHATQTDAESGVNPLFVTTPGSGDLMANAQQPVTPYTKLVFSVPHRFIQNDQVTVSNASGNLPTPLLPATSYYVRYLTANEITLHTTLSDAATGANPIILTDAGTGTSAVVKLIPATANVGSTSNISAPNSNLSVGDFVQFNSTGNLPTPLLSGQVYVVTNPVSGSTFTIAQPPATSIDTLGKMRSNNVAIITTNGPHGLVTGNTVNISGLGGVGYNLMQVTVTVLAANAFSYECTGTNDATVATLSRCRSNQIAVIVTAAPHGFATGDYVNIQGLGGSNYNLPWVQVNVISTTVFWYNDIGINDVGLATANRSRTSGVAAISTIAPHGLSTGQFINIQGMTDPSFDSTYAEVTVVSPTEVDYNNAGPNLTTTDDAQGYVAVPQSDGNGLVGEPLSDGAGVVSGNLIDLTDTGSGVLDAVISRAFTIGFYDEWFLDASNLTTGASFKINSSGALPGTSPSLSPLTTYYARVIDDYTAEFFVSKAKALDTTVRLTASYARSANVATIVTQSAHGFATNDVVEITFMADASFNTAESLGSTITVVNATTFTYASTGANASTTSDTAGQVIFSPINILSLGSGETDMIISRSVIPAILSNLLEVTSSAYLLPDTLYEFTTTGTLPAPLMTGTFYGLTVVNGQLQITTTTGSVVVLTSIGSGNHFITRDFEFSIGIPQGVQCLANEYNIGDPVVVNQPGVLGNGTAPHPLVSGGRYYLRPIDEETVQIYDSAADAQNLQSTNGLIVVTDAGEGTNTFFQILPAVQFARIDRVLLIDGQTASQAAQPNVTPLGGVPAPIRNGYIDLYAWDNGRSSQLTLLGHYAPNEYEPSYRRIKTLLSSAWIRMRYRRKTFEIRSLNDYIPLTSQMAILYMVRAQELYRTNFFDEAAKYEALSIKYLIQEHESSQGPEAINIQFNDPVFMDPSSKWMV